VNRQGNVLELSANFTLSGERSLSGVVLQKCLLVTVLAKLWVHSLLSGFCDTNYTFYCLYRAWCVTERVSDG